MRPISKRKETNMKRVKANRARGGDYYVCDDETHHWFSVSSPSVFKEYKLPSDPAKWTTRDKGKFNTLKALAEIHGAAINRNSYRTG